MQIFSIICFFITLYLLTRNILLMVFSMENYNVHRKRMKQLRRFDDGNKKEDVDVQGVVELITKPIIRHILTRFKPRNLNQIERDLRMAKWDKYFSPIQFVALGLTLKIIGVVMFFLLYSKAKFIAVIWGMALCFGLNYLMKNSMNNRREKLIADFPDFIRISEGYLSAGVPFAQAVAECIKFVGEEWQPILQDFVINCNLKSVGEALEQLKLDVDLFEVREFVSLIKLNLEQGGSVKESFTEQADKVREMQIDLMMAKIGKRQMMGIAIQAPLLICNLLVFGLPTVNSMMTFSSM